MRSMLWTVILTASLIQPQPGVRAAEHDHDEDQERARRALEAGEILPLDQILQQVEAHYEGTVVELELTQHDGRWVYEVELLAADDRLLKLLIDAKSRQLLREDED